MTPRTRYDPDLSFETGDTWATCPSNYDDSPARMDRLAELMEMPSMDDPFFEFDGADATGVGYLSFRPGLSAEPQAWLRVDGLEVTVSGSLAVWLNHEPVPAESVWYPLYRDAIRREAGL